MTKVLSRDAIQRMISQRGSTTTVSGGGGEGGVSAAWIEGNYVAKNYWDQIFTVHGKRVVTVTDGTTGEKTVTEEELTLPPNVLPSSQTVTDEETGDVTVTEVKIVSLQVNAGIWTNSFVSALGLNPEGGGGGGADLNALLASINTSAIGSVAPGASNVGKCLVWTADGWAWGTTGSSGGGTVTAITAGTGLSGGTITSAGTISISTEYQTRISHGQQAWQWGNHANAGYLTPTDIADMATKSWVEDQGFVKSSGVTSVGLSMPTGFTVSSSPVTSSGTLSVGIASGYFMPTTTQRTTWNNKQDAISDLDTIRSNASHGETAYGWGNHANAGYLTPTDIADMATKSWVENQGFVKSSGVTSVGLSVPTGFTVSGSPVTTSGTLALGIASGYFMPTTTQRTTWNNKQDAISDIATIRSNASHGQTAYGWGNHANAGYLLRTEGMRFTSYGNYIAARFVNADGTYDATRAAKAQGDGYIEWWSSGGYFNHVMGFIRANGNVEVGTSTSDTTHYLQIGGGRLYWDSTNNALYVQKVDSQGNVTAANFYATGGVSALGMSVGGTPSMNTLTLQNLTVNGSATVASLTVRNTISSLTVDDLDVSNNLNMNGCDISMDGGYINNCSTLGADAIETGTLLVGSGSELKKIQWDGTYLQVQIGTTTYKFRPDVTS